MIKNNEKIKIENLTKIFNSGKKVKALENINLKIKQNEFGDNEAINLLLFRLFNEHRKKAGHGTLDFATYSANHKKVLFKNDAAIAKKMLLGAPEKELIKTMFSIYKDLLFSGKVKIDIHARNSANLMLNSEEGTDENGLFSLTIRYPFDRFTDAV